MKIKVLQIGKSKLAAVKLIKNISGLSIKESKEISENPEYIFKVQNPNSTFAYIEKQFNIINAKVELVTLEELIPKEDKNIFDKTYIIRILSKGNNFLQSVKVIHTYSGLNLRDCKTIMENIPSMFTVKLSDNLLNEFIEKLSVNIIKYQLKEAKTNVGATEENLENKIYLRITIMKTTNKILLIKSIRSVFDLGLKEAKNIADTTNTNIYCSFPENKIEWLKTILINSKAELYFTLLTQNDFPTNALILQLRKDK